MGFIVLSAIISLWVILFILRSKLYSKWIAWLSPKERKKRDFFLLSWLKPILIFPILLIITQYLFLYSVVLGTMTLDLSTETLATKDVILFFGISAMVVIPFATFFIQSIRESLPFAFAKYRKGSLSKRFLLTIPYTVLYFILAYYVFYLLLSGGYINL